MKKKVLSIFGDEFFPQVGIGHSSKKRQESVDKLIEFFKQTQPDLVYIICIRQAMEKAKSFVLMDDEVPLTEKDGENLLNNSVDFLCNVSDAIVFFYSKDTTPGFHQFMEKTCSSATHKNLWELVYDGGKMLGE